jgi:hypothetical protein
MHEVSCKTFQMSLDFVDKCVPNSSDIMHTHTHCQHSIFAMIMMYSFTGNSALWIYFLIPGTEYCSFMHFHSWGYTNTKKQRECREYLRIWNLDTAEQIIQIAVKNEVLDLAVDQNKFMWTLSRYSWLITHMELVSQEDSTAAGTVHLQACGSLKHITLFSRKMFL